MKSDEIKNSSSDESGQADPNSASSPDPSSDLYPDQLDSGSEYSGSFSGQPQFSFKPLESYSDSKMKIYGSGKPVRLFIAGLHGDEWKDTTEILWNIKPSKTGTLALIPLVSSGKYVSTLDPDYYPGTGKKILKAVEELKPEIYIELHSYSGENFEKLAGENRLDRIGVPAYSVLNEGVLLGSVSPWIRKKYFSKEALCLSFEVRKGNLESRTFTAHMLDVLKETKSRDEFIAYMSKEFPVQAKKAIEDYRRFYGEI